MQASVEKYIAKCREDRDKTAKTIALQNCPQRVVVHKDPKQVWSVVKSLSDNQTKETEKTFIYNGR